MMPILISTCLICQAAESKLAKFVEDIIVPPRMIDIIVDGEVLKAFLACPTPSCFLITTLLEKSHLTKIMYKSTVTKLYYNFSLISSF